MVRYHSVLNPPHLKPGCNHDKAKQTIIWQGVSSSLMMQWCWPWFSTPVQLMHLRLVEVTVVFRRKWRDCLLFHIHLPLHDVCSNLCFRYLSWFKDYPSKCPFVGFSAAILIRAFIFSDIFRTIVWLGQVRHFWVWLHHRFLWFNPKWKVRGIWLVGLSAPVFVWILPHICDCIYCIVWGFTEADDWFYGIYLQTLPYF